MNATITRTIRDLVLLLARIGLGIVMIVHAKIEYDFGGRSLAGLGQMFEASGIPLGSITGPANVIFEVVGGIALILGLAVPMVGVLMAINMVGAWVFVHNSGLLSMDGNGPELAIMTGLLSLVLAVTGSGRLGLDHVLFHRRRDHRPASSTPRTLQPSQGRA